MPESLDFQYSREAAKITLGKVSSWEELNAATAEEGDKKFSEATKKYWDDFAVSGTLQYDPKEGKQVLRPFTDLDGRSTIGVLQKAGIDTKNLSYIRPGEYKPGAINFDTGDKFGVVYDEATYTAYFDHHAPGTKEVTSSAEIMYKAMVDLGMVEKTPTMDKMIKFVTDIDNRRLPAEEFLRSGKTILGLQRALDFEKMVQYFEDHDTPTETLTPEEFSKYGLEQAALAQQKVVDEAMATLDRMVAEGKIIDTPYGKIVVNENNELKVGSAAAYVKYDGIINITPGKSFGVTLKGKDFDEQKLRERLGDKFQGKIIRGKMWIYNEKEPLKASLQEIIAAMTDPESVEKTTPSPEGSLSRTEKTAAEFRGLFASEKFIDGYVERRTTNEQKAVDDVAKRIKDIVDRKLKASIEAAACAALNVATVDEGKRKGKEWGSALKIAEQRLKTEGVVTEVAGVNTTLPFDQWVQVVQNAVGEEFREEKQPAERVLATARDATKAALAAIGEAFDRALNDKKFKDLLDKWREAPSLDGSIKHSGLVHFIEYRSDKAKDRLKKVPEAFSPEGFMEYTERIMKLVENPKSEEVLEAMRLKDQEGKERLLLMTKDDQYISAFRDSEQEPWRVITHIPDMEKKQWEKTKTSMRDATAQQKYHNRLTGTIQELPF